jgi:predicted dehydrogenase
MADRLRIGLLSAAHVHADAYAPLLDGMPEVELIGLADDDAEQGRSFASLHGVPYLGDRAALLQQRPDAVVVTSPNARHRADVEALAAAGVGVLCEKPLATTVDDAVAIVRACHAAGVPLMTAFPMRFSSPIGAVASEVRNGSIGRVCAVAAVNQGEMPSRHRAWFADPDLAGGGALMDHTVHVVDVLRWMLDAEVTEVYAATNRILHADRAEVETGGLLLVHFGEVMVTIDCSWSRPDSYPTWGGLGMEIVGERGVLDLDAFRQRFTLHAAGEAHGSWIGLRAVEVVAAAYASAASGEPAKLDLVVP